MIVRIVCECCEDMNVRTGTYVSQESSNNPSMIEPTMPHVCVCSRCQILDHEFSCNAQVRETAVGSLYHAILTLIDCPVPQLTTREPANALLKPAR